MKPCVRCGSFAINHHQHGRDGSDRGLCDVCYWRERAEDLAEAASLIEVKFGRGDDGVPSDWTEWFKLRQELKRLGKLRWL